MGVARMTMNHGLRPGILLRNGSGARWRNSERFTMNHMAIDQYGQTYHGLGKYPRKGLLERLGRKHADKMYIDTKSGKTYHVGYIIAGLWLTIYTVQRMERSA